MRVLIPVRRERTEYSAKAWQQAYDGAKKGSMQSFEQLMAIADPNIKSIAMAYARNKSDYDDFCQSARLYIIETVNNKEDVIKKVKNYFLKSIKMTIKQQKTRLTEHYRRFDSLNSSKFADAEDGADADKQIILADTRRARPDVGVYVNEVLKKISKLPDDTRPIMEVLFGVGGDKSNEELAQELGLTLDNVYKKRERARTDLRKECEFDV